MALLPYPQYKKSGIEWLGSIPEHWNLEKPKWFFKKLQRPISPSDEVITCFRDGMVTLRKNRRVRGFTESIKEIGYQGIRKGDLIIHAMDAFAGAVGVSDSDGKGSPVYSVCMPNKNANSHYYAYLIREMSRNGWILALATGIRERSTDFRFKDFSNQLLPILPVDEQIGIVKYLQFTNNKIQKFIQVKKQLIKLLEEKKQNIIHSVITGKINVKTGVPYDEYKKVKLSWIEQIPSEWNIIPIGSVLKDRKENNNPIKTSNILSLSLKDGVLPYSEKKSGGNKAKDDLSKYVLAYPDDIVINSMNVVVGSVGLSKYFGAVSPVYYVLFKKNIKDNINFFNSIFQDKSFQLSLFGLGNGIMYIQSRSTGKLNTIRIRIPLSKLKHVYIPYPNSEVHDEIVEYLDIQTAKVNELISKANAEIKTLNEYRSRLVADLVTGKIDVRKISKSLPDEIETPKILEVDEEASEEIIEETPQLDENESN